MLEGAARVSSDPSFGQQNPFVLKVGRFRPFWRPGSSGFRTRTNNAIRTIHDARRNVKHYGEGIPCPTARKMPRQVKLTVARKNKEVPALPLFIWGFCVAVHGGIWPALALELPSEPANALSLPTWAIHVSSVTEWWICMGLVWKIGSVSGYNSSWRDISWGMLPLLGGAMCACTWHVFYNAPELNFLVALQATLTFIGNGTMWYAAYRLMRRGAQVARGKESSG